VTASPMLSGRFSNDAPSGGSVPLPDLVSWPSTLRRVGRGGLISLGDKHVLQQIRPCPMRQTTALDLPSDCCLSRGPRLGTCAAWLVDTLLRVSTSVIFGGRPSRHDVGSRRREVSRSWQPAGVGWYFLRLKLIAD
jgi:hypothetical protein